MTRTQFYEEITDFGDLLDFCRDEDCCICEDVYDESDMDEMVNDRVADYMRNGGSWYDLKDELDGVPQGYSYYRDENGSFDWAILYDDDFESYRDDVAEWMSENGYWDEEEEEDDEAEEEVDLMENPADEDFSAIELFTSCKDVFLEIENMPA